MDKTFGVLSAGRTIAILLLFAFSHPASPAGEGVSASGKPDSGARTIRPILKDIEIKRGDCWIGYSKLSGGSVPGDSWVPLHLIITNNSRKDFDGIMTLKVGDYREGNKYFTSYSVPVRLTGYKTTKHISTEIFIPERDAQNAETELFGLPINVNIKSVTHADEQVQLNLRGYRRAVPVRGNYVEQKYYYRELYLTLGKNVRDRIPQRRELELDVRRFSFDGDADSLPRRWNAYAGFDSIIWDGMDLSRLDPALMDAVKKYIQSGGHLIVACGDNRNLVLRSFLAPLLPCALGEQSERDVGKEIFGAGDLPLTMATSLSPKPGAYSLKFVRGGSPSWTSGKVENPLAVRGSYGAGTVTVLGFSLSSAFLGKIKSAGEDSLSFWSRWADPVLSLDGYNPRSSGLPDLRRQASYYLGEAAVKKIPGRAGIAAFLVVYLLILVPLTYTVFKGWRRLELAWLAMPVLSILFFYGMYWQTQSTMAKSISVTEFTIARVGEDGRGAALVESILYSPSYGDYQIAFEGPDTVPTHLRFDADQESFDYKEREHYLRIDSVLGRPVINDFNIGYNDKRLLEAETCIRLGNGMSAEVGPGFSLAGIRAGAIIGKASNRTGFYFAKSVLLFGDEAVLLEQIPPADGAALTVRPYQKLKTTIGLDEAARVLSTETGHRHLEQVISQAVKNYAFRKMPYIIAVQRLGRQVNWRIDGSPVQAKGLGLAIFPVREAGQ